MKEKGKSNPFIGHLRPDEEILWFYKRFPLSFKAHLSHYIMRCLRVLLGLIFAFAVLLLLIGETNPGRLLIDGQSLLPTLFRSISSGVALIVPISLPSFMLLYPFMWMVDTQILHKAYAVTNERILSYSRGHVSELTLEEISALKHYKNTISFGGAFPKWNDIEETAEVVSPIEQAQIDFRWHHKSKHLQDNAEQDLIDFEDEDLLKRTEVR